MIVLLSFIVAKVLLMVVALLFLNIFAPITVYGIADSNKDECYPFFKGPGTVGAWAQHYQA
jgi:hypothetical protein